ncbi:hypothetical protein AB0N65_18850 [Paenarthrobacter sp. NPDC089322]|uniref:hypothetical protein n=1 Tax=Paenarthrobacter sp. NPDC089322 TaxID=3155065 RepID=UPI00343667C0
MSHGPNVSVLDSSDADDSYSFAGLLVGPRVFGTGACGTIEYVHGRTGMALPSVAVERAY